MTNRRDQRFVETAEGETGARRSLLIMSESGTVTRALPAAGELSLGRSEECDLQIDDPRLSRKHVILRMGEHVEVVDLGSRNGTLLGARRLVPNTPERVGDGDRITLGSTVLLLQQAGATQGLRLLPRPAFDARTTAERAAGVGVVIVELACKAGTRPPTVEEALAAELAAGDAVAVVRRGVYEVLLVGVASAEPFLARLRAALGGDGVDATARVLPATAMPEAPPPASPALWNGALAALAPVIDRVAAGAINVLIVGETGVGKEVVAQTIHERSPRAARPFLALNCAALSESLLESELFGHEKGAFTGAAQRKLGLLEVARGGTVFLDEIGEMPPALQAKLLRVFEQREVLRVGGLKAEPIDVRFVAATHRDLAREVAEGRFRQDFYFRLNGISIAIPPLRERKDEILPLALRFVGEVAARSRRVPPTLDPAVERALLAHPWPGNVRELRNVVERAVVLAPGATIGLEHLQLEAPTEGRAAPASADAADERQRILDALDRCAGNQTKAAKLLGYSLRTLVSRLDQYGIPRPRK
jgi:DNA-binding NtrC family response regulator